MAKYYIGTITKILDDSLKTVEVKSEGIFEGVTAYPKSSENDEPKIGDPVLLLSLDDLFNSYFLYEKLKESRFIGFRSLGKMVNITDSSIDISVYDKSCKLDSDGDTPGESEIKARIRITDSGDIEIMSGKTIKVNGKSLGEPGSISVGNIYSPGQVTPYALGGPFCALTTCPYTGLPHAGRQVNNLGSDWGL